MNPIRERTTKQDRCASAGAAAAPSSVAEVPMDGQRHHKLKKLVRLKDEAFVEAVFGIILGRPPDAGEVVYHRDRLRDGRLSKVGLINELRSTKQGRKHGAAIKGLGWHRWGARVTRIPVLGPILLALISWARLPRLAKNVSRIRHQMEQLNQTIGLLRSDLVRRLEAMSAEISPTEVGVVRRPSEGSFDAGGELRALFNARIDTLAAQVATNLAGQVATKLAAELRQRPQVLGMKLEATVAGLSEELARLRAAVTGPGRERTSVSVDALARRVEELEKQVAGLRAELGHELSLAAQRSDKITQNFQ